MDFINTKANSSKNYILPLLGGIFLLAVGFFVGSVFFPQNDSKSVLNLSGNSSTDLSKLNAVVQTINSKFYYRDRLSSSKIEDGTIKGYLNGLEDFPTRYLNTQEYSQYKQAIAGNIFGIGIEIGANGDGSKILSVYSDTPASKAGLVKGDIIIKVDNKDTSKMAPSDVASLIRGPIGSKVTLVVTREGNQKTFDITRDQIYTSSVTFDNLNKDGKCKITISRFTDDTVDKWKDNWNKAVDNFKKNSCTKLVLDLRGNGGGYVEAAKYAIGEFVPDGNVIYGSRNSNGTVENVVSDRDSLAQKSGLQTVEKLGSLRNVPISILINSSSASASEIFSGSLQTLGRAKLVGTNSFGKGSVQETTEFNDGSSLIYTIANWTLPNGTVIDQNFPIKPDYVVSISDEQVKNGNDPQLDKAEEILGN